MARDQVVRVDELSRHFGDKVAVDRVSFDIARSEVFGFLGPNGAGKTTTIKMLTTLLPPTSGRATVLGRDLKTEGRKIRAQIGLIWDVPKAERRRRIDELIGHFEMEEFRKMPTVDLSAVGIFRNSSISKWPMSSSIRRRRSAFGTSQMRPICARILRPSVFRSRPSTVARPDVGGRRVVSILIVVVFPAPFGPRNPNTSERAMSNETRSTATLSPKCRDNSSTRTT